ncbi:hypothetical protein [Terrabacter sp. 2YAF2]|uniref:hypothetical protein n=1 Tax=Terrabacter sp. 2YAF2 TaxID=3233026 RepID=UPI003F985DC6
MTAPQTFHGIVASRPEQTVLDDDRGIIFWVQTDDDPHTDAAQVFLSATRADQVEGLDLAIGSELTIEGAPLGNGVTCASALRLAEHRRPRGRVLGTVEVHVPDLARLDPGRERRYQLLVWGGVATIVVLGVIGMVKSSVVGNIGFIFFLLWGAVLVWDDLRTRKIDDREYAALSNDLVTAVRSRLNIDVPPQAVFDMLGGGLERTGNPWRPMRPRRTGPAYWVAEAVGARLAVDITPQPLQANAPATITVVAVDEDHPA